MARQPSVRSVVPLPLRRGELQDLVRRLAKDSDNVFWTEHALERMEEREISDLEALRVLKTGDIIGDVEPGQKVGEWKCKMVAKRRGAREIGVVALVQNRERLRIATVEWEDL